MISGVITKLVRRAEVSGIAMESVNAEYDEGQFELTLEYGDAVWAADEAVDDGTRSPAASPYPSGS